MVKWYPQDNEIVRIRKFDRRPSHWNDEGAMDRYMGKLAKFDEKSLSDYLDRGKNMNGEVFLKPMDSDEREDIWSRDVGSWFWRIGDIEPSYDYVDPSILLDDKDFEI